MIKKWLIIFENWLHCLTTCFIKISSLQIDGLKKITWKNCTKNSIQMLTQYRCWLYRICLVDIRGSMMVMTEIWWCYIELILDLFVVLAGSGIRIRLMMVKYLILAKKEWRKSCFFFSVYNVWKSVLFFFYWFLLSMMDWLNWGIMDFLPQY